MRTEIDRYLIDRSLVIEPLVLIWQHEYIDGNFPTALVVWIRRRVNFGHQQIKLQKVRIIAGLER